MDPDRLDPERPGLVHGMWAGRPEDELIRHLRMKDRWIYDLAKLEEAQARQILRLEARIEKLERGF